MKKTFQKLEKHCAFWCIIANWFQCVFICFSTFCFCDFFFRNIKRVFERIVERNVARTTRTKQTIKKQKIENDHDVVNVDDHLNEILRNLNNDDFVNFSQYLHKFNQTKSVLQIFKRKKRRRQQVEYREKKKNLNFKWKLTMNFDECFDVYTLSSLYQKNNICFHCYVFQYDEKCHVKFNFSKYWHCCFNDKILNNIMKFENDDVVIEILFDDFEKNILRLINVKIKRELHDLLWKYELNEIKSTSEKFKYKKIKRCKKFHELNIIYNNVFFLQRDDENEL